jgi:hypothetical protein
MRAVDASDSNLSFYQSLSSLGVPGRNILVGGGKDLDHFRSNITLTIRKAFHVSRHGQHHVPLGGFVGMTRMLLPCEALVWRRVSGRCVVFWNRCVVSIV